LSIKSDTATTRGRSAICPRNEVVKSC
jgi:hypothetical protein